MADRGGGGEKENPSASSNPSLLRPLREEGELSSGAEDEGLVGRAPNLEPSNLSFTSINEKSLTKIGAIATTYQPNPNPNPNPIPSSNPSLQRFVPPHSYRSKSYNKRMPYNNKLPANRNLSWQKKKPLDDTNLVISFSDDESESDNTNTPSHAHIRSQATNSSVARNSNLKPNISAKRPISTLQSNGAPPLGNNKEVLESLRHEIALREKSLKIQKIGSVEVTDTRPAKRAKVGLLSNGTHSQSAKDYSVQFQSRQQNGDAKRSLLTAENGMGLPKADNGNGESSNGRLVLCGTHQADTASAWLSQNSENTDIHAQLQSLLEQEDAHDRELEQAQEIRRRMEREERESFKAFRRSQRALFDANERCNLLQRKRDLLSTKINSLLETSNNSNNTPWPPLCWPTTDDTTATTKEEGQLTDSTNTRDQLEEEETAAGALSDADKRGSLSGNSSPQQDYEALEASLRSELVARYRNKGSVNSTKSAERERDATDHPSNDLPSKKDFMESAEEERMFDQENLFAKDVIDQPPSNNSQEKFSFSPSVHGINLQSKNLTGLIAEENLAGGGHEESNPPLLMDISLTESNQTPPKLISEPGTKTPAENITTNVTLKTSESAVSPFVLPPSTVRNTCVHLKHTAANSYDACNAHDAIYEKLDIVSEKEERRVDPFWPFCIFELRGRCNDEECRWQHFKDFEWRKVKSEKQKENFLTSPSGVYQHLIHVPTHQIGSCLINDWQRGTCASFPVPVSVKRSLLTDAPCLLFREASIEHQYNEISSSKLFLEEDLPEAERCFQLALSSSLTKRKVLLMLARALERNPKSVLIWVVYLHIYYMNKKHVGKKDDMFLDAVRINKYSYDLWLMYMNSRLTLEDQINAFSDAISTMCQLNPNSEEEHNNHQSSIILDLYLHMVNILCMSGNNEIAISRVLKYSSDKLLTSVISSLVVSDKCIFWVTSIYLSIYKNLPEGILEQFQLDKELFVIDWQPLVNFRANDEIMVLGLFEHAFVDVGYTEMDINRPITEGKHLKELHFLAINHVKCMAAVRGQNGATDLVIKYKKIFPNSLELALVFARLGVVNNGFENVISDWRRSKQPPGIIIQCVWNQYAEHYMANKRFDLARDLMSDWYREYKSEGFTDVSNDFMSQEEHIFGLLNLCLYHLLLDDDALAAHNVVNEALKIANQRLYKHCIREHVIVCLLKESMLNQRDDIISSQVVMDLIRNYLTDARAYPVKNILSRKFYQDIKKSSTRKLLDEWLGSVSTDCSLVNSILEMCYGELLIPEHSGIKEIANLVESVTQICPANYRFALSVCRFVIKKFDEFDDDDIGTVSVRFWSGSVLINSIFHSVPVAPEIVWVKGAETLVKLKLYEISNRFLEHAVSVYPFSLQLWQLYLSLSKRMMNENGNRIVEAARKRGIELPA